MKKVKVCYVITVMMTASSDGGIEESVYGLKKSVKEIVEDVVVENFIKQMPKTLPNSNETMEIEFGKIECDCLEGAPIHKCLQKVVLTKL